MYEAFDFGLHAPIAKLYFAEFVGTHNGGLSGVIIVLLDPIVPQRTPLGFD